MRGITARKSLEHIHARGSIGRVSIRNFHRLPQARECEFLRRHGLCKQKALDHVKVHFAYGEKVSASLYTLGDRATAKAVDNLEDLPACGTFQAIIRAACNELTVDLDFDKREVVQPHKRETFRSEIVNRNGDVAEPNLSCDGSCQVQIGNEIRAPISTVSPSNAG